MDSKNPESAPADFEDNIDFDEAGLEMPSLTPQVSSTKPAEEGANAEKDG